MAKPSTLFHLLRWPIDICVFGLALSYGVSRILQMAYHPGPVPFWLLFVTFIIVAFVSVCVVRIYMPSDERLEGIRFEAVLTMIWINVSLLLSTAVPILGVLYSDTLIFWIVMVIAGLAKGFYSLEDRKRGVRSSFVNQTDTTLSFWDVFVFEPKPDAYALRTIPTAILMTMISTGLALLLFARGGRLGFWSFFIGFGLVVVGGYIYTSLSGTARVRAIKRDVSA